jgi:excisionase family DNA binding protein
MNKIEPMCLSQPLWTVKDVSKALNVKEGTIRYWVHIHAIRFHKLGGLVRFIAGEIYEDLRQESIGKINSNRRK